MGCWSPLNAMEAYIHSLQLCKKNASKIVINEPECLEFISALAAGNQAQLMVDITSNGTSPATLALAIAARYTGGRLVCICPNQQALRLAKARVQDFELGDVVSFKVGKPCDLIREYKKIDFAVVDRRIEGCERVLSDMEMNPEGSVVVVSNLFHGTRASASNAHTKSIRARVESTKMLPFGNGMEVIKVSGRSNNKMKRSKRRTFLVYEEY